MRDGRLGRHAALDQARRRGRLQHHALASPAGGLGAPRHQDLEPRRDHVQPLRSVGPDLDQRTLAARAGGALRHEHPLDAGQVRRQPAAARPAPGGVRLAQFGRALLCLGLVAGQARLDLLERELQLVLGQALRAASELHALQLVQQVPQLLVPRGQRVALLGQRLALGHGRRQQRAQRLGIVGQALHVETGAHRRRV
jgi:hypothetical protein